MIRDCNVLHRAAVETYEVVVMPLEPLGQLIAGEALGAVVGGEDASFLEDRQGAIDRRQGKVAARALLELGRRERALRAGQRPDHGLSAPGISDLVVVESLLDLPIQ
jgi:hypothetical protein